MRLYKAYLDCMGRKGLPWMQELAIRGLFGAVEFIDDLVRGPDTKADQIRNRADAIREGRRKQLGRASDLAVRDGLTLWDLRKHNEVVPWREVVNRTGMSLSTARNLMNLAAFAHKFPEMYERLKTLGPSRLYRISRLPVSELNLLDLNREVQTERGPVLFAHLSDKEMARHLRRCEHRVEPTAQERRVERMRRQLTTLQRLLLDTGPAQLPVVELRSLGDRLQAMASEIHAMLPDTA